MITIIYMNKFSINCLNKYAKEEILSALTSIFGKEPPVIVCVGTDAVIGDGLGPLVGSMLKEKLCGKAYVFGCMDAPITAFDIESTVNLIKNAYPYSKVLAIDAALGKRAEIGTVKIVDEPLKPGLGVNKRLINVGNASMVGVVAEKSGENPLLSVRMARIYRLAEEMSSAIACFIKSVTQETAL